MKVQQMFDALPILRRVIELKLPIKKAYQVYSLVKIIGEQQEFFSAEERKLIDKYPTEIMENGNVKFHSIEDKQKFTIEHNELMQYEIEGLEPVELTFSDLGDERLSPKELMLLEGAINLVE